MGVSSTPPARVRAGGPASRCASRPGPQGRPTPTDRSVLALHCWAVARARPHAAAHASLPRAVTPLAGACSGTHPAAVLSHAVPTHTLPTRAFATGATPVTTHVSQLGQITGCRSFEGLQVVLGGSEQVTHDT